MNTLLTLMQRATNRRNRRADIRAWGDARALPFTEGQAVVAPGQIGPAIPPLAIRDASF